MINENKKFPKTFYLISEYRGALMGLAILCIMIFHYTEDCHTYGVLSGWKYWFYYYIRSSFVDAFLFLSGFGLYFSFKKKPDIVSFYKKRFTKISIPYLLIAIPSLLWRDLCIEKQDIVFFVKDLSFAMFFQEGRAWFWYILLIMICYLIFPYVFAIFEAAENHISEHMYMMSVFSFFTVICLMMQSNQSEVFGNVQIALLRIPVFFFGCMIGKAAYERREIPKYVWGGMVLSLLMLPLAEDSGIVVVRYVLSLFNLSLCMFFVLCMDCFSRFSKIHDRIKTVLEWLGKYSLELYLSHVALRTVMNEYGFYTYRKKNELIMLAMAFVLALIVKKLTDLILSSANRIYTNRHGSVE